MSDELAQTIHKALDQASEDWTPYGHQAAHDAVNVLLRMLEQRTQEREAYEREAREAVRLAVQQTQAAEERVRELEAALKEIREIAREDANLSDAEGADHPYQNETTRVIEKIADAALADCNRLNRPEGE